MLPGQAGHPQPPKEGEDRRQLQFSPGAEHGLSPPLFHRLVHLVVLDEGVRRALWFSFQLAGVHRLSKQMLGLWENLTDRQKMIGRPGWPGTSCTRTLPSRCSPARLPRCNLRLPTTNLTSPSSSFSSTATCTTWLKCSLEGTCLPTIA